MSKTQSTSAVKTPEGEPKQGTEPRHPPAMA